MWNADLNGSQGGATKISIHSPKDYSIAFGVQMQRIKERLNITTLSLLGMVFIVLIIWFSEPAYVQYLARRYFEWVMV
jgi:hypothetical protein